MTLLHSHTTDRTAFNKQHIKEKQAEVKVRRMKRLVVSSVTLSSTNDSINCDFWCFLTDHMLQSHYLVIYFLKTNRVESVDLEWKEDRQKTVQIAMRWWHSLYRLSYPSNDLSDHLIYERVEKVQRSVCLQPHSWSISLYLYAFTHWFKSKKVLKM